MQEQLESIKRLVVQSVLQDILWRDGHRYGFNAVNCESIAFSPRRVTFDTVLLLDSIQLLGDTKNSLPFIVHVSRISHVDLKVQQGNTVGVNKYYTLSRALDFKGTYNMYTFSQYSNEVSRILSSQEHVRIKRCKIALHEKKAFKALDDITFDYLWSQFISDPDNEVFKQHLVSVNFFDELNREEIRTQVKQQYKVKPLIIYYNGKEHSV